MRTRFVNLRLRRQQRLPILATLDCREGESKLTLRKRFQLRPGAIMRYVVVALAIVGVLLCPYDCAVRGASCAEPASKEAKRACCAKCRATAKTSKPQSPGQEDPRQDGHSCLCEGAVFATTGQQELDFLQLASHLAMAIDVTPEADDGSPVFSINPHERPPRPLSGRLVRIVNVSFLL